MYKLSPSLRIGVLRGGPSPEYDVSLRTGGHVLEQLSETHQPIDIFISKNGTWHVQGIERNPERILNHVDVVFNALHGTFGEDGTVQDILDNHGVRYTGSDKLSSAIAMNKWMTKESVKKAGIKTPVAVCIRADEDFKIQIHEALQTIPFPMIIKPLRGGSSVGVQVVLNPIDFATVVGSLLEKGDDVLVEEYIKGREATCGVIDNFREQNIYSLPVIEIILGGDSSVWDYESKYNGKSKEICPGNFSLAEKKQIEEISAQVHSVLGLSHYSRSDFIVTPKRGIYFLEVNTLPGLTRESLLPVALDAVGVSMKDFLHHVIGLAMEEK